MDETEKIIIDRFKEMFSNPELLFENKKLLYKTNLDREIRDRFVKSLPHHELLRKLLTNNL